MAPAIPPEVLGHLRLAERHDRAAAHWTKRYWTRNARQQKHRAKALKHRQLAARKAAQRLKEAS